MFSLDLQLFRHYHHCSINLWKMPLSGRSTGASRCWVASLLSVMHLRQAERHRFKSRNSLKKRNFEGGIFL